MQIPFKARIRRVAGTFVVTVPSDFVNNGVLPEGKELQFFGETPEDISNAPDTN